MHHERHITLESRVGGSREHTDAEGGSAQYGSSEGQILQEMRYGMEA